MASKVVQSEGQMPKKADLRLLHAVSQHWQAAVARHRNSKYADALKDAPPQDPMPGGRLHM